MEYPDRSNAKRAAIREIFPEAQFERDESGQIIIYTGENEFSDEPKNMTPGERAAWNRLNRFGIIPAEFDQ